MFGLERESGRAGGREGGLRAQSSETSAGPSLRRRAACASLGPQLLPGAGIIATEPTMSVGQRGQMGGEEGGILLFPLSGIPSPWQREAEAAAAAAAAANETTYLLLRGGVCKCELAAT